MDFTTFIQIFGAIMIIMYLVFGIDDLIWNLFALLSKIFKWNEDEDQVLDFAQLRETPAKMLAVCIAAWHESNVIGHVLSNFLETTDYPHTMYHVFIGVYPNDLETIEAVREVGRKYPNVHAVINCMDGPTTKAQNINHTITQIKEFEKENNIRFASLTIHDSEDVIHAYELLATNYLIDKHDALQFPVFPILKLPRFRNFFSQMTTATYADEFAENHYSILVQRKDMGAFVPCAGTGFALSRKLIESFGDEPILPSDSLTEDYLLSMQLYKRGTPLHYVLDKLPRVLNNGRVKIDFITTRSLFPGTFKAAVKQKTRWTYGISMQSVGMKDVFGTRGISFLGRYSFYKDVKTKLLNLLPFLGYIVAAYCVMCIFMDLPPLYEKGTIIYYLAIAVFVIMIIRQIFRAYALGKVYGARSVFFGCLLPPLFPIRLIYGNIINFVATERAFRLKLFGDRKANKKAKEEMSGGSEGGRAQGNLQEDPKADFKADPQEPARVEAEEKPEEKKKVKWAKTDHEFLTRDQLQGYHRRIGDALLTQRYLTPVQLKNAILNMPQGEYIGSYLVREGMITERQMAMALAFVQHVIFVPGDVLCRLDYPKALASFDKEELRKKKILPLAAEDGSYYIAITTSTAREDIQAFKDRTGDHIRPMYTLDQDMDRAFDLADPPRTIESLDAYSAGELYYEQAVLIGIFAAIQARPEKEIRSYMGL